MPERNPEKKKLSRQQQRELDVAIGFLEGIVRRDPEYADALKILGDDYTRRGKFQDGLQVDEHLARLHPEDPLVQYNLACSYSLTGRLSEAAAAIEKALDLGYREFTWLVRDPDLKALRADPGYEKIQTKIKKLKIEIG